LRKAGEDAYGWIKRKINPKLTEQPPQVLVRLESSASEVTKLAPSSVEQVAAITYGQVKDAILSAPPLQQESVAERYIGLRVEWDTYFRNGYKKEDGLLRLYLSPTENYRGADVICDVSADDYRELSILPEGTPIRVSGEIATAAAYEIELKSARLQFTARPPNNGAA
jgi:hypothetical protein